MTIPIIVLRLKPCAVDKNTLFEMNNDASVY